MVRIDGRSFSSFTRNFKRPFDEGFHKLMVETTAHLIKETGAKVGYTQSDEISLVLYSDDFESQIYFDGKVHKMVSSMAAQATAYFNKNMGKYLTYPNIQDALPTFDCRVWNVPSQTEAVNTLIWREIDATKNSVQMLAREYFSHKELDNKGRAEQLDMLHSKNINWNTYPTGFKRGTWLQRKVGFKEFSPEEISKLPEKHPAKIDPSFKVERASISIIDMPILTSVSNRVDVIFNGAQPKTDQQDPQMSMCIR
jgi:tRNA(His) 5'-end guanylyltransferase